MKTPLRPLCVLVLTVASCKADPAPPSLDEAEVFAHVETLVGYGVRSCGTEASELAANYVADKFRAYGLTDVRIEQVPTVVWENIDYGLRVDGRDIDAFYMQHTPVTAPLAEGEGERVIGTPQGGVQGRVVYVGDGDADDIDSLDLDGAIVVADVRFNKYSPAFLTDISVLLTPDFEAVINDPEGSIGPDFEMVDPYSPDTFPGNLRRAAAAGAVGFVGVLVDYIDSNRYHNEAYRAYRSDETRLPIPGLWVTRSGGEELVGELGAESEATLEMRARLRRTVGLYPVGYLRGEMDETLMVGSHHDSTTLGAVEDASGTASVLALAQYFGALSPQKRRRNMLFATMDTHFSDYACHMHFVEHYLEPENVVANVTIEHVAREVRDAEGGVEVNAELLAPRILMVNGEVGPLEAVARDMLRVHNFPRTILISTEFFIALGADGLPADSSHFWAAGVPTITMVGSPIYLYDDIDTLDKVPADELLNVATGFVDALEAMHDEPAGAFAGASVARRD